MLKLNEKSAKSTYIILALSIIMLVIVGIRLYSDTYAAFMQKDIASQIIRFHIRANDDSEEAQNNKMLVKAAVLDYISPKLSQSVSLEESRQILSDESDNIKNVAVDKLRSLGSKEDVSVYFENCYFPMKSYGDMTFPPGEYEAFRIDIGEASGRNWWCVLYPPLCFVDAVYGQTLREGFRPCQRVWSRRGIPAIGGQTAGMPLRHRRTPSRDRLICSPFRRIE